MVIDLTAIISAGLTGVTLIIVQLIISKKQQRTADLKNEYIIREVQGDIKRLETKQDKHNSLIERTVIIERDMKTAWKRIDEVKHDVERLEDERNR